MHRLAIMFPLSFLVCSAPGRGTIQPSHERSPAGPSMDPLTRPLGYTAKRSSSYDRTGGNADFVRVAPGETVTLLDEGGPGVVTHLWATIASPEEHHLKKLVIRMYWDGEEAPSVEAPLGDFFCTVTPWFCTDVGSCDSAAETRF